MLLESLKTNAFAMSNKGHVDAVTAKPEPEVLMGYEKSFQLFPMRYEFICNIQFAHDFQIYPVFLIF